MNQLRNRPKCRAVRNAWRRIEVNGHRYLIVGRGHQSMVKLVDTGRKGPQQMSDDMLPKAVLARLRLFTYNRVPTERPR